MRILKGIPVSPGVVIGRALVVGDGGRPRVRRVEVSADHVDREIQRFDEARLASIAEISELHKAAETEMGAEAAKIFLFHIGALSDKALIEPVKRMIADELVDAAWATHTVFERWAGMFSRHKDPTFRTKVSDLNDLSRRVVGHLFGMTSDGPITGGEVEGTAIACSRDLTPSQTADLDRDKVGAMATDLGGRTSHTAIVARALGLPAVVGLRRLTEWATSGMMMIVDGDRGTVVLDPDDETIERYTRERDRQKAFRISLDELADEPAITQDGVEIQLLGNIEFPAEAEDVLRQGGSGVGLYRTEFLYLTSREEPTEEDHFQSYAACIKALDGKPLTIRTVDLGADKYTQARAEVPERNPFLGLRSMRYCLQNLPMFRTQLRAILRASALGPVKVMFPLITSVGEFRQGKSLLKDAMEDLTDAGQAYDPDIQVGMMMEVPSAALLADAFCRDGLVDFMSIGTNDLVQYTLAVDRTNERVAQLYNPAHPAVVKLIRDISRAARRHNVDLSCCGESAGDLEYAPLLVGLGLRTLSVTASSIPPLKRMLRSLTTKQCERIARKAISFESEVEAAAFLRDRARAMVPEAFDGRSVADHP